MKLRLTPGAEDDIIEIQDYYLANAPHIAHEFIDELFDHLNFLKDNPAAGVQIKNGYRMYLMSRFPYYIIYELTEDLLLILHIVHRKRDPKHRTRGMK